MEKSNLENKNIGGNQTNIKQKIFIVLISMILLSATALAVPQNNPGAGTHQKAPVAAFSAHPTSGYAPLKVAFTDKSTGPHISYKWSFGDGTYSTSKNPVHKYTQAGNYTVSLKVSNAAGNNTKTKSNYIVVNALKAPVAAFSARPTAGTAPLKVAFIDKSTGVHSSWKWSFGDGTYSREKNPVHKYTQAGNYTVSLKVSNAAGNNTVTKSNYIAVNALKAPVAAFSARPTSGYAPLKVKFTDRSTGFHNSWKWSFGDGTYSKVKNPEHKYNRAGNYTVSLKVSNASGNNTKTMSNYIIVKRM
ncbi:MAG: PKD domain-containing protein [Alphaproteobacteria bacterium]|nr:MAG: PKD domain-containing protein [Alphaproteobacteria bacterium]